MRELKVVTGLNLVTQETQCLGLPSCQLHFLKKGVALRQGRTKVGLVFLVELGYPNAIYSDYL